MTLKITAGIVATGLALLAPMGAFADGAKIAISDAYARSSNPKSGAAYMILKNEGETACTLTSISTTAADMAELHTMRDEGGVMKMMPADPVVLAPGASHSLTRGADHVMLMGLHEPLQDGAHLPMTLNFGDCGTVNTEVPVDNQRKPDAPSGAGHQTNHSSH